MVWTFDLVEELEKVPETYLKHIENTEGLFEIRVQQGSDIFRIFCFFDQGQLIVLANGFQKKTQKTPKKEIVKALKIKKEYEIEKSNTMTLDEFKDKHYGKRGSEKREELEAGYENFKIGALLYEARLEKGLTQEELAAKSGTTKSYISKIENDVKEVRISTLQKIVEVGLGGKVQLSIKL
ncbi:MAG: type II toxin-antitoxin system RelE/ParE family toxin [Segetibacter sp.]